MGWIAFLLFIFLNLDTLLLLLDDAGPQDGWEGSWKGFELELEDGPVKIIARSSEAKCR
jgi:hypothetical protein